MQGKTELARRGRVIALVIALSAALWVLALALGDHFGWSQRILALFDLAALAGFTFGLWLLFGLWRLRRTYED